MLIGPSISDFVFQCILTEVQCCLAIAYLIGLSAADPTQRVRASGLAQMSRDRRAGERNRQRNPQFLHAIRRQTRRRCGPGIRMRRGDLSTFAH